MFDANGGSGGWTKSLDYGSAINVPEVFRQGCTFEGWLPTPESTVPAHDVAYVAQWKVWDITVSSASAKIKYLYPNDYQRITNVVIVASVTYLPDNFFDGCDALESVTFVSPDTELGNNDLRKVGKLFANQPDGYWIVQGVLLGYKGVCPREIPGLDSVKRVMGDAIEGCAALEELSFTAESVLTTIGTNAFKHCTELRQMTLPPSLIEIGNEAFMGCSYLGNVIVPGSVKKVGDRAFKNCTGFTAAQIEYGVESLGSIAMNPIELGQVVVSLLVVLHDDEIERAHFDAVEYCPMGLADVILEQGGEVVVANHIHQDGMVSYFPVVFLRIIVIVVLAR